MTFCLFIASFQVSFKAKVWSCHKMHSERPCCMTRLNIWCTMPPVFDLFCSFCNQKKKNLTSLKNCVKCRSYPCFTGQQNVSVNNYEIPYSNGRYRDESHESSGLFGTGSCRLHSSPLQAGSSLLQQKCSYVNKYYNQNC